eukprot:3173206-Pleurochrysis_carterae.AAC.3
MALASGHARPCGHVQAYVRVPLPARAHTRVRLFTWANARVHAPARVCGADPRNLKAPQPV